MKKTLLILIAIVSLNATVNAQQSHMLTFEAMYQEIIDGIAAGTEVATFVSGSTTKILVNKDRTSGIFTLVSPSSRTFRLDSTNATFVGHAYNARIRLEPNGASNTTNGRKIYIDAPAPGKLIVACWTASDNRGYTVENAEGAVLFNTNAAMTAVTTIVDLPLHEYTIATAGRIVLNPNAGFYYAFVEFIEETNSVKSVLADKGITYNGNKISNTQKLNIEVYNVVGKLVAESKSDISLDNFQPGIYMVRAKGEKGVLKFIK